MYLYHFFEKATGPFRNLSDLSVEEAWDVVNRIRVERPNTQCAQRHDKYVEYRVKGDNVAATKYKEMANDELKHAMYEHEWAVKEIEKRVRDKNNDVVIQSAIAEANMIKQLDIRCTGPDQFAGRLSGGNQQKVCLARAITMNAKLLIVSTTSSADFCNPFGSDFTCFYGNCCFCRRKHYHLDHYCSCCILYPEHSCKSRN